MRRSPVISRSLKLFDWPQRFAVLLGLKNCQLLLP